MAVLEVASSKRFLLMCRAWALEEERQYIFSSALVSFILSFSCSSGQSFFLVRNVLASLNDGSSTYITYMLFYFFAGFLFLWLYMKRILPRISYTQVNLLL